MRRLIHHLYPPGVNGPKNVVNRPRPSTDIPLAMPPDVEQSAPEQDLLLLLMDILDCSERHARAIYIYHVDSPGPACLAYDHGDPAPTQARFLPELLPDTWLSH